MAVYKGAGVLELFASLNNSRLPQISITREYSLTPTYNLLLVGKYRLFISGNFFSVIHGLD